jgi:hypothetical protein
LWKITLAKKINMIILHEIHNTSMTEDDKTPKPQTPKLPKPIVKPKMPVGKIQGKGLKVSPPRMNNSPRGR